MTELEDAYFYYRIMVQKLWDIRKAVRKAEKMSRDRTNNGMQMLAGLID